MEAELNVDHTVELTETVFHHWVKVLRAQVGETATLFNGQGGEYEVTLSDVAKSQHQFRSLLLTQPIVHLRLKLYSVKS